MNLVKWSIAQRSRAKKYPWRAKLLNDINFVWSVQQHLWEQQFSALVQFKKDNGHFYVPHTEKHKEQRRMGGYPACRPIIVRGPIVSVQNECGRMNAVGFIWDAKALSDARRFDQWKLIYDRLAAEYKSRKINILPRKEKTHLARWERAQRGVKRRGKMSENKISLLKEINFLFEPMIPKMERYKAYWNDGFEHLKRHRDTTGGLDFKIHEVKIPAFRFARIQRTRYKNGTLTNEHRQKLEGIGFTWGHRRPHSLA